MTAALLIAWLGVGILIVSAVVAVRLGRVAGRGMWLVVGADIILLTVLVLTVLHPWAAQGIPSGEGRHAVTDALVLALAALLVLGVLMVSGELLRKLRRQAEEMATLRVEAESSMVRYRLLVEAIPEVFVLLENGKIRFANRAFARIFKMQPEEALGRVFAELIDPSDRHKINSHRSVNTEEPSSWSGAHDTVVYRRSDGEKRWLEVRLEDVTGSGETRTEVGLISDVTELYDARHKLVEEEEFQAAILGTMDALVVVLGGDGRIVRFNAACERLTGYSAEEVEGIESWEMLVPERERPGVGEVLAELAAGHFPSQYENHWVGKDGVEHLIAWRNTAITGEGGDVRYVVATGIDVGEQRWMERTREVLYEISEAAQTAFSPDELFPAVQRALGRVMPADNLFVAEYDAERDLLRFPYYRDEADPTPPAPMPPGKTLAGYVLRTGQPLLVDPETDRRLRKSGEAELVGPESVDWIGAPLVAEGQTLGVLAVQSYKTSVRFSERERDLVALAADQLARAVVLAQTSRALRESELHYRLIFESSPAGLFRYSRELVVTDCNPPLAEMLGSTRERIVGLDLGKLRDQRILPAVRAALAGDEGTYVGPYEPTTGDRPIWASLRTAPLTDAAGAVIGGVGMVEDLTPSRWAQEAIERRDAVLSAVTYAGERFLACDDPGGALEDVLERIGMSVAVSGVHVFQNRRTAEGGVFIRRAYGWAAEEGDPARLPRVLREEVDPRRVGFTRWQELMSNGRPVHGPVSQLPCRERRVLGGLGLRSIVAVPILVGGQWWGFILLEDREREREWSEPEIDALRLAAGTLGAALHHRESERQLRTAQKMEAVGQLAGGIAHDFNNLLMAIRGAAEQLQGRLTNDAAGRHSAELIHDAAERAAALTRRLLAFARRQVIAPRPLDLNDLLSRFLPTVRRMIPESIDIDFIPARALGAVLADSGQLEQIVMNLLVNARDAMPGGGTVSVETEAVLVNGDFIAAHPWAREGRYALLSVSDTGTGMDGETMAHVFEPFFTTKGAEEGTGLGLATVYGIVKQHEGMIHVYSEPEKGTTFKVYLPIVERRAVEVGPKLEGAVKGGAETLLVVEDDPAVRGVMEALLAELGYAVLTAEDGVEALEVLRDDSAPTPDLVISDIVMPRMGGRELLEEAGAAWPDLRFLFTTGYSENVVHEGFVRKEGIAFLSKPFGKDTLARKVREMLGD